jgi:hypothetical protein
MTSNVGALMAARVEKTYLKIKGTRCYVSIDVIVIT